jgi:hypothetical protein
VRKNYPYIFVIGFNKTGTTSIHKLFENNGIPSIHWDQGKLAKMSLINILNGDLVFSGYDDKFNVFSDMFFRTEKFIFEGNSLFRQMDNDYPGSFFIYNKRNINDWINSRIKHKSLVSGMTIIDLEKKISKSREVGDIIDYWTKSRSRFEEDIKYYFRNSKFFMEIDIEDPNFVDKISEFTGIKLNPIFWKKYNKSSL